MAAYVIVNITIRDSVRYEEYKRLATPTVGAYGGHYVVRGGSVDVREGGWTPSRLVVLEFPTVERARAWWDSPEYAPAKAEARPGQSTLSVGKSDIGSHRVLRRYARQPGL